MHTALKLYAKDRFRSVQARTRRRDADEGAFPTFAQAATGVPRAAMTAKKANRRIDPASSCAATMTEAAMRTREVTAYKELHMQAATQSGTSLA